MKIFNQSVKFKIKEVKKNIFHLEFNSRQDLTSTMIRFQEHYESPFFRDKVFTHQEFISWYKKQNGRFTYLNDWSGFNIPSIILKPFYEGKFGKLSKREEILLEKFKTKRGNFYIIATYKSKDKTEDLEVLKHELAHGFYFLDQKYNTRINQALKKVKLTPVFKYLKKLGYHKKVWEDETHAYFLTDLDSLRLEQIDLNPYLLTIKKINDLFNKKMEES